MENNKGEQKRERIKEQETRLRKLSDSIKCNNICTIGIPEEKERKKGAESLFVGIIAENFPNLGKETDT